MVKYMEYKVTVEDNGDIIWRVGGKRHRENGPAMECADGTSKWFINGELHREDGPAFISKSEKSWWIKGERHRENGPAIEWADGGRDWYINGQNHRTDGPAVIQFDGTSFFSNAKTEGLINLLISFLLYVFYKYIIY
jgi:hypothetical protein